MPFGTASTVPFAQFKKKDCRQVLGAEVHVDAILDRIVHGVVCIDMREADMR